MARFYGAIGFSQTREDPEGSGIWKETITIRRYPGAVIRNIRRYQTGDSVNESLSLSNQISVIADPYLYQNIGFIRYIEWMGSKWKVTDVERQDPRLVLTVGGLYNGEEQA